MIILSDGFDGIDELTNALRHLRHRRHEVIFFQVLAPEEEEFPFKRPTRFRNLENFENHLRVDPSALRKSYLEKFHAFCATLKERVEGMGADYHKASTAVSPEKTLLDYLASRSGRRRSSSSVFPGGGR